MGAHAEQQSGQSGDALVFLICVAKFGPSGIAGRLNVFWPLLYEFGTNS